MHQGWTAYQKRVRKSPVVPAATKLILADPLADLVVPVPDIHLVTGLGPPRLEWRPEYRDEVKRLTNCLPRFIKLAEASDDAITAFAKEWGPLGICEHGMPGMHWGCSPLSLEERYWENETQQYEWFDPYEAEIEEKPYRYWEPIEPWRYHARRLRAFVVLAADLHQERPTRDEDWIAIFPAPLRFHGTYGWERGFLPPTNNVIGTFHAVLKAEGLDRGRPADMRQVLANGLADLLNVAALYPQARWTDEGQIIFTLGLSGQRIPSNLGRLLRAHPWPRNSLFSVLVTQLAAAVSAANLTLCQECHGPLPAGVRSTRRYCDDCRVAKRKERQKGYMKTSRTGQRQQRTNAGDSQSDSQEGRQ